MRARGIARTAALAAVGALVLAVSAGAVGPPVATYEVTIENLTKGQPFTPPVVATHRAATDVFDVGSAANQGVKEIAENGNLTPLLAALDADRHVYDVASLTGPVVPSGLPRSGVGPDTVTVTVTGALGANRLSFVSMLICTNDGFTGADSLLLPNRVGETAMAYTNGYDAGTERNTEDLADIVPPCQGLVGVSSGEAGTGTSDPALAEVGVIRHHPGVAGGSDLLPGIHGWDDPVAKITIERVS